MSELYPWQKADWTRLLSLRASQGLLLGGMKGTGKLELALNYARFLLCRDADGMACGVCPSCRWFEQGTHPDFRFVQPESETEEAEAGKKPSRQISVDQIRGLADFLGMSAHQGGRRVVIIHPAESMNTNAANALLKSLEEPPEGLLFILVSHKPQTLLPTLLSRCLTFMPAVPDTEMAVSWLTGQGVKNPRDALALAGFSPLLAVGTRDGSEARDKLLRAIRQPARLDVFALADALQKTEQVQVVQWMQHWCCDLMSQKMAGRVRYHPGEQAAIAQLVASLEPMNLARLHSHLQTAKRESQHTLNAKLFFESLFITYRQLTCPT